MIPCDCLVAGVAVDNPSFVLENGVSLNVPIERMPPEADAERCSVVIVGEVDPTPLSSPEALVVIVLVAIVLIVLLLVLIVLVVVVLVGMVLLTVVLELVSLLMMLMVVRLLPASGFILVSPCVTLAIHISNTSFGWHSSIHPTNSQELSEFDNSASFLTSPRVYDCQCMPCVRVQISHAE